MLNALDTVRNAGAEAGCTFAGLVRCGMRDVNVGARRRRYDGRGETSMTTEAHSEDDSWDLTTSVGTTAVAVAAIRALISSRPQALISDPYAQPLVDALGVEIYRSLAAGIPFQDESAAHYGQAVADGIALRTRFFDDFLIEATRSGLRQVVVLACGLDTRPQRLTWPPGVIIYELDQPGVVEFKVRTLAELGVADQATVHSIGVDLREDWAAILRDHGFDPAQPTAWIAEALLPYLPAQAQGRVLDTITELSSPGSKLAVDWYLTYGVDVEQPESDDMEDARTMVSTECVNAEDYLRQQGWTICTQNGEERFVGAGMADRYDPSVGGIHDGYYSTAEL